MSNIKNLYSLLNNVKGKYQQNDPTFYNLIRQLITAISNLDDKTDDLNALEQAIIDLQKVIQALEALTFLTASDESVVLINSRELLAGTNITFDDTIPNQRTISSSGSSSDYVLLGDGGPTPLPIDDGFGSFVYVSYTP